MINLTYNGKITEPEILAKFHETQVVQLPNPINSVLHGDNFEIMSNLLKQGFDNAIDLIYIDPPFATNNDFLIGDRISTVSQPKNGKLAYTDKFTKEEYLNFMHERLYLMHKMLSVQGSLYLHIDCKIGHYVKIILDEIFGESNFISEITRRKSNPKNFARKAYGNEKDTIYFYAKNKSNHIWNDITIPLTAEEMQKYAKTDENGNRYNTVPVHAPGESSGVTGGLWRDMPPPTGRHWRTSPQDLDELDRQGLIEWSKNGNPRLKKFAHEHTGKKIQDIWDFKDPAYPLYPTQKNSEMLELIVRQSSAENSLILDCFAGSGTALIAAKKHGRNFIGIDNSEIAVQVARRRLEEISVFQLKIP